MELFLLFAYRVIETITTPKATTIKIIVVSARISTGIGPFLILDCTKVDKVSIDASPLNNPGPLVKAVMIKSSKDKVIDNRNPDKIPGKV